MVFSQEDKGVIKNDFLEKNWSVYRTCKEHLTKKWNKVSIQRLLKRFHKHGSMDRRPGSGRPQMAMMEESQAMIEGIKWHNDKGIKMNSKLYEKHLEKELIPDIKRIMNGND